MKRYGKLLLPEMDCMELIQAAPDNTWDLAIVDPPYGINENGSTNHTRSIRATAKNYKSYVSGDKEPPSVEYFKQLRRVSRNQIVFGANHFIQNLPFGSSCWIVWDKDNGSNDFADCELAWTSFDSPVRRFRHRWQGMLQENMKNKEQRIHPNQKPVELYRWLLGNYAKPGDLILDTHLGSGSIALACYYMGFHLTGCELDPDYYATMMERIERETKEQELF